MSGAYGGGDGCLGRARASPGFMTPSCVASFVVVVSAAAVASPAPHPWVSVVAASMREARLAHTATALPDGRVLVVGGEKIRDRAMLSTTELYDPGSGTWRAGPDLPVPRSNHSAVALDDGSV